MIKEYKTIDQKDMYVCSDGKIFGHKSWAVMHEKETNDDYREEEKPTGESTITGISGTLTFRGTDEEQKEQAIMIINGLIDTHDIEMSEINQY